RAFNARVAASLAGAINATRCFRPQLHLESVKTEKNPPRTHGGVETARVASEVVRALDYEIRSGVLSEKRESSSGVGNTIVVVDRASALVRRSLRPAVSRRTYQPVPW